MKATQTFIETIRYAIDRVGIEKVLWAVERSNIRLDGVLIVQKGMSDNPLVENRALGNGYFTNTHSDTFRKKAMLEKLVCALDLPWRIEVLES